MNKILPIALLVGLTGCFHFHYITEDEPLSPPAMEAWHGNVVFGLIEVSDPVDVPKLCPAGYGRIDSEMTFLNGLVTVVTLNIYNAQTVTVACRAAPVQAAQVTAPAPPPPPAPTVAPPPAPAPAVAPPPARPAEEDVRAQLATGRIVTHGILFDSGSAVIRSVSNKVLRTVLVLFKEDPSLRMRIEGYTDDRGNAQANTKLSEQRALAVKRWLSGHGVSPKRLEAKGLGASNPIASNDTPEGRAQNRRVEFVKVAP